MPAAHNSKTINDNEMKFGGVSFNCHMTSLCVKMTSYINVKIWSFYKNLANQSREV